MASDRPLTRDQANLLPPPALRSGRLYCPEGRLDMPTASGMPPARQECLQLASTAVDFYVQAALTELAGDFQSKWRQSANGPSGPIRVDSHEPDTLADKVSDRPAVSAGRVASWPSSSRLRLVPWLRHQNTERCLSPRDVIP